jgi:hypothetical protein
VENWQLKINKSKVTNTFGKVFPTWFTRVIFFAGTLQWKRVDNCKIVFSAKIPCGGQEPRKVLFCGRHLESKDSCKRLVCGQADASGQRSSIQKSHGFCIKGRENPIFRLFEDNNVWQKLRWYSSNDTLSIMKGFGIPRRQSRIWVCSWLTAVKILRLWV